MIYEAKWNCFRVSLQPDILTLIEAIRNIYIPDLILASSSDIKIAINILEAKEVAFTLVINKKYWKKSKVSLFSSMFL